MGGGRVHKGPKNKQEAVTQRDGKGAWALAFRRCCFRVEAFAARQRIVSLRGRGRGAAW